MCDRRGNIETKMGIAFEKGKEIMGVCACTRERLGVRVRENERERETKCACERE